MLDLFVLSPLEVIRSYPPHDYTLGGLLASRARHAGFLLYPATTYATFQRQIEGAAGMLLARGIDHGERVAVMPRNSDHYVLLFFALARIGAIMVPVNPDFGAREAGYILAHAAVSAVAASEAALPVVREAIAGMEVQPWLMLMDGEAGDVPHIAPMIESGAQVTARAIAEWCRERFAAIKQPRYVVFVESLPVTATQRVQKFQLRSDSTLLERAVDLEKR
jgi:acyl-CoA synthetase (AMP-forming)/AMP-acid ligase II